MKEQVRKILKQIDKILTKLMFFGHPPPKSVNWDEIRVEILNMYEEEERRREKEIQQAKAEEREKVLDEIKAGAVSLVNLIEGARIKVAREIFEEIDLKMLSDWVSRCSATLADDNMSNALVADGLVSIEKYLISKQFLKNRFLKEEK